MTLAQMAYDGIGSRVVLTGWVSGVAYTTTYGSRIAGKVQILQATSSVNSTSYLYGLSQIAEFGSQSVYYLTDGAGSIRHLVDPNGAVKSARLYEPFGQVLMRSEGLVLMACGSEEDNTSSNDTTLPHNPTSNIGTLLVCQSHRRYQRRRIHLCKK